MGSFRFGRDADEIDEWSEIQRQAAPSRRRSLRNFGGSMRNIFSREADDIDPNTLSDFQQQSLSVFESEHMWAHFKAHLADNKIQTAAGVRAMLPEFVNDRVLDGSVVSDRPVYPASSIGGSGSTPHNSMDASERCNSIDYSQTLRGDAGHVRSLHETVNAEAQKNSDAKGLGKVLPACLAIDNSKRSVFSSLGWSDEPSIDISDNKKSSDHTASLTLDLSSRLSLDLSSTRRSLDLSLTKRSLDLSSRRASFLATLGMTKEAPMENISSEEANRKSRSRRPKFVRPVESIEQTITDIIEGNSVENSDETVDKGDAFESKPFSYRPNRSFSAPPDLRNRPDLRKRPSVSSRAASDTDTLLVEWGDNDDLSSDDDDEEVDETPSSELDDSERAVVMGRNELVVDWKNDKEDDDDHWGEEDALDRGISGQRG